MKTIRNYLQELTLQFDGVNKECTSILNECEKRAKGGLDYYIASVLTNNLEETVDYLKSVAKLDVEVTFTGAVLSTLEISWTENEK